MKRFILPLLSLLLATVLLCSVSLTASAAEGFDFDREIAAFTPDAFNTHELLIGEAHEPQASLWAKDGTCYTSDASVVTVADNGTVTALSEGRAYVAIVAVTGMFQIYRYDVMKKPVSTDTELPQDTDTTDDTPSVILPSDPDAPITEKPDQDDHTLLPGGPHHEPDDVDHDRDDGFSSKDFALLGFVAAALALVIAAYMLISALKLSSSSVKQVTLPPVMHTRNTLTSQIPLENQGPTELEIPIHGKQTAQQFVKELNQWLAENPFITDCSINLTIKTSLLSPFVTRKFFVKKATISYRIGQQPNALRYGTAFLYKLRFFGSLGYDDEKLLEEWKHNNPDCHVLSTRAGHTRHIGKQGVFAHYYDYVFFTK